jgi:large subunit ribosomal protein L18
MKRKRKLRLPHRRKREGKTDYHLRLRLLKSKKTRFVVRRSVGNMICQLINYDARGDKVLVSADSKELASYGWKGGTGNIPAAYLTGLLCAQKAKKHKTKHAILDIGLFKSTPGSRIYATLKGALDGGLEIPHSEDVLPKEDRLSGKHIAGHALLLKKSPTRYNSYFSGYAKRKSVPEDMEKAFNSAKKKIMEGEKQSK